LFCSRSFAGFAMVFPARIHPTRATNWPTK